MSREIKFRVWRPHKKEMQLVTQMMWGTVVTHGEITHVSTEESDLDPTAVHIMQFTGLLDKNGKEIYEGDVVKWDTYWFDIDGPDGMERKPITKYGNVVYFSRGFWIQSEKHPEGFGWEGEDLWDWREIEVIGNIFENPDLLSQ